MLGPRLGELLALEVGQRLDWRSLRYDDVLGGLGLVGAALHGDDLETELLCRAGDRRNVADIAEVDITGCGRLYQRRPVVETGELDLADALDTLLLKKGVKAAQMTHLFFSFSGNAAKDMLKKSLDNYDGPIPQTYVGLHVDKHQSFIEDVFKAAGA